MDENLKVEMGKREKQSYWGSGTIELVVRLHVSV